MYYRDNNGIIVKEGTYGPPDLKTFDNVEYYLSEREERLCKNKSLLYSILVMNIIALVLILYLLVKKKSLF